MSAIKTLAKAAKFSLIGYDVTSRRVLFNIALINSLGFHRKRLRARIEQGIARHAIRGEVGIRLRRKSPFEKRPLAATFRQDLADYQSLYECLSIGHYCLPKFEVRHVFDAGANIGCFTLASERLKSGRDYVAVEPNPRNLDVLCRNIPFAKILPFALDRQEHETRFEFIAANTGHLHGAPGHPTGSESVSVSCRRLGDLMPKDWNPAYTWLKIDIEGAEYVVMRDFLKNDTRRPGAISMEIHDYLQAGGLDLVQDLNRAGYRVSVNGSGETGNVCRQIFAELR